MKWKIVFAAILIGSAALAIRPNPAKSSGKELVGSWQLTLTAASQTTTPTVPVVSLVNFTSDGGAVGSLGPLATAFLPAPVGSTPAPGSGLAVGNWNGGPIPGHAVFKLVSVTTDTNGMLLATQTVQALVTPNGDNNGFTGTYSLTVADALNNLVASGSGTVSGTPIGHFLPPTAVPGSL
ncbi:MAG TPA: hypothetical protein VI756_22025 [Blastocatellia bacterium]